MARIPNDPNIPLQNYHPKPSGTRVFWQPNSFLVLGLTLGYKKMDWSQAEQGRAETLHVLVTNLHRPASTQCRKEKGGSCLKDFEVQVPQTPAARPELAPSLQRGCSRQPGHPAVFSQNPGKEGVIYRCHELNPLALLQFCQHACGLCACTPPVMPLSAGVDVSRCPGDGGRKMV